MWFSLAQLIECALSEGWVPSNIVLNGNGAVETATITWPDGTTGIFTAVSYDPVFLTYVNSWTATYVGSTTHTVTQAAITRNANTGEPVNAPIPTSV